MKRLLTVIGMPLRPILLVLLRSFFEKKYLRGRYFENSLTGFAWAIRSVWQRNILRLAPPQPFPVGMTCKVANHNNLHFHPDDLNNLQAPGTYYQNELGHIIIGKGCYIGPNVGLITANHNPSNPELHTPGEDIILGEGCWIGMNSVVLPGTQLGPGTVVAAGSVVTKSFRQGHCIVAGVPAKVIKKLKAASDREE